MLVAYAAAPTNFVKFTTATSRCDGGESELRVKAEAKGVVAVSFEFQNGPLGFNVYREINRIGQQSK